jgi:hypothetical protein
MRSVLLLALALVFFGGAAQAQVHPTPPTIDVPWVLNNRLGIGPPISTPPAPIFGYGGTLTPRMSATLGSIASPDVSGDATGFFMKEGTGLPGATSQTINGALWGDIEQSQSAIPSGAHATGVVGQANVSGTGVGNNFYEGVRGNCNTTVASATVECTGVVAETKYFNTAGGIVLGMESALDNGTGTKSTYPFDASFLDIAFLATCNGLRCGTAFALNPFSSAPFNYGFYVPKGVAAGSGIHGASFQSDDITGFYGLELEHGVFANSAIKVGNGGTQGINGNTAGGSPVEVHMMYIDTLNNFVLGNSQLYSAIYIGDVASALAPINLVGITFVSSGGLVVGTGNSKGVGTVNAQVGYYVNGVQGVSCGAGTVSLTTLVISNGIATHC